MEYLDLEDVLLLHDDLIVESGDASGMRDLGAVESAVAQPQMARKWLLAELTCIQRSPKKPPRWDIH